VAQTLHFDAGPPLTACAAGPTPAVPLSRGDWHRQLQANIMARIDATLLADRLRCETESQHPSGCDRGGPGIARNYRAAVAACSVGAADADRGLVAAVVGRFIGRGRRATLASTAANALREHTVRLRAERHNRGDIVRRDGTGPQRSLLDTVSSGAFSPARVTLHPLAFSAPVLQSPFYQRAFAPSCRPDWRVAPPSGR